jgi:hypothetical protein
MIYVRYALLLRAIRNKIKTGKKQEILLLLFVENGDEN